MYIGNDDDGGIGYENATDDNAADRILMVVVLVMINGNDEDVTDDNAGEDYGDVKSDDCIMVV